MTEYFRKDIGELFKKEEDILKRIGPYCDSMNKKVNFTYSMTATSPLLFVLQLTITE